MTRALLVGVVLATTIVGAQTPPRDVARITMTGAGGVTGSVVADDSQRGPLRHAIVTLSRTGVEDIRTTTTDEQGTFVFDRLPAGTYSLAAAKGGYISASFGALQPGMPGTPITLTEAQRYDAAPIALMKGAVIAGRLTDAKGHPIESRLVHADQIVLVNGDPRRRRIPAVPATSQTNAHGEYRLFGLPPGEYYLYADAPAGRFEPTRAEDVTWGQRPEAPPPPPSRSFLSVRTYFPGTANGAGATKVVVGKGQEATGIDFAVQTVPASTVSGRVVDSAGRAMVGADVIRGLKSPNALNPSFTASTKTAADGSFQMTGVAPGEYSLDAFSPITRPGNFERMAGATDPLPAYWGTTDAIVNGEDVANLVIRTQPGVSFSGKVVFKGQSAPVNPATVRIQLFPLDSIMVVRGPVSTTPASDGTFVLNGVLPLKYRVDVTNSATNWFLRSVIHEGTDVLDQDLLVGPDQDISGVVVTYVDVPSEIHGHISDRSGRPAPQFYVFVFPEDRSLWTLSSRRIRSTRANSAGDYLFEGLAPGTYRLCALSELDSTIQTDPGFLEQLLPASISITLADGEKKKQDLRIGG